MRFYIWLNVHVVREDDWTYVDSKIREVIPIINITPISSTEVIVETSNGADICKIFELKFVDKVGTIVREFDENSINELLNFLKESCFSPVIKVRDFRLRSVLSRVVSMRRICEDFIIIRDYYDGALLKVAIIKPLKFEMFYDFIDMWWRCLSDFRPIFVVSGLSSENEVLSCVRIAAALRVRLYLVSPRIRFSCRKKLDEFKKFLSLAKCRIVNNFESIIERFRGKNIIIGLSMHAHRGEVDLYEILERDHRDPVFLVGGELWGLSVREIDACDHVVRLGPSTGVPMSASEVISYVTCIVRSVRRRPRC
ncbi:MAG: TrmH family RNA methyltransferase [Crenarchaeota archaeon]|nr:TrmH family RNA methyltransferase [Thermoproteota archaeon]